VALKRSGLGWKQAKPDRCFAIFALDPNNKDYNVSLEAKSVEEFLKWEEALVAVWKASTNKHVDKQEKQ